MYSSLQCCTVLSLQYYSVTVSVTTIKGTESRLLELGRVADITGGKVDLYDCIIQCFQQLCFFIGECGRSH